MRIAARIDANQREIVKALRGAGASVHPSHQAGKGFPDLVVGFRGVTLLFEVKDGEKPPSERKLTPHQQDFFNSWEGQIDIVISVKEALDTLFARTHSLCGQSINSNFQ